MVDSIGKPVANAAVRLRNLQTGKVAGSMTSSTAGTFTLQEVNPGTYVAELVGGVGKVVAASQMVPVAAGQSVSAFISLPAMLASLGGTIAANAAVATIIIAAAAAAGVLAVQANDCVSPPCQ
ncbi:MAG: carboxypeptidase regulatory-like domain-containing protein [Acidobacteria bacterium]|nr:carboxypeptidase regulatory-like domain-containing protein [Acidobacteriota bacterium]